MIRRALLVIGIGVLLANILADWLMGCGEHYVDHKGAVRVEQCHPKGVW